MLRSGRQLYVFSLFKFDSETGDLLQDGRRTSIPGQGAQVLAALLEQAGIIVTREELRHRLWPDGIFIADFDHSINKIVGRLRVILGDIPRDPRFIETVPKKGYRFIAPVTVIFESDEAVFGSSEDTDDCSASASAEGDVSAPALAEACCALSKEDAVEALTPAATAPLGTKIKPASRFPLWRPISWRAMFAFGLALVFLGVAIAITTRNVRRDRQTYVSIGIPPFEATGPGTEELAESFRMDLTEAVSRLPAVQVRAAHSFSNARRDDAGIRADAQALQLDVLLYGKLALQQDHYILQFELVRGRDATHLASLRYSGTKDELGSIRDKIQRDLFDRLGLLQEASHNNLLHKPGPGAYEDYLQARYHLSLLTDDSMRQALREFQSALDQDPQFASAYAGMANAYAVLAEHEGAPRESSYRSARELAAKAATIDPSMAEAHAILGQVALRQDWNFELAEHELRRAVELEPNQAMYHIWLSVLLCDQSRFEESFHQIDLAHSADPLWPPVYMTETFLADSAGHLDRAIHAAEKLTSLLPNRPLSFDQLGWAYWRSGRYLEAIASWRRMAQMENDSARLKLEDEGLEAFRRGGVTAYARVRLKAIESGSPLAHVPMDFVPAEWYSIAGEHDRAIGALEDMVAHHDPDALQIAVNWTYLPLHKDPRFAALLVQVGLNPPRQASRAE